MESGYTVPASLVHLSIGSVYAYSMFVDSRHDKRNGFRRYCSDPLGLDPLGWIIVSTARMAW